MTTLNARANQAWHEAVDGTDDEPFDNSPQDAFEEGWETGYKAAYAEAAAQALEDAAEEIIIPGASSLAAAWLQGRAARLRNEVKE